MAKKQTPAYQMSIPEQIDRLGELQHQIGEAQLKFAESIAPLLTEEKALRTSFETVIDGYMGEDAAEQVLDHDRADRLVERAAQVSEGWTGKLFRLTVTVRNNRVLNMFAVRKLLGQKKFNEIAQVTIKDLGNSIGKEDIDKVTHGYKPSISMKIYPVK